MPKISTYQALLNIHVVNATPWPTETVAKVASNTMKNLAKEHFRGENIFPDASLETRQRALIKYLYEAEHLTPLEFVQYTFFIENLSRAGLAQLTRHRTGTFMVSSQHYQNVSDYPAAISIDLPDKYEETIRNCYLDYSEALDDGVAKEEARQLLPAAATCNVYWAVNARNLAHFLKQRLCLRNTEETCLLARRVQRLVLDHFPALFTHVGPQCWEDRCKQGSLQCKRGYKHLGD